MSIQRYTEIHLELSASPDIKVKAYLHVPRSSERTNGASFPLYMYHCEISYLSVLFHCHMFSQFNTTFN